MLKLRGCGKEGAPIWGFAAEGKRKEKKSIEKKGLVIIRIERKERGKSKVC